MRCPVCAFEVVTTSTAFRCQHCTWVQSSVYEVPTDPMDGLECEGCQ